MNLQQSLAWIDSRRDAMLRLLADWSNVNSGTFNLHGIAMLQSLVEREFAPLGGELRYHDLPPVESIDSRGNVIRIPLGRALSITKRPDAPVKALLSIHLDTVYPPDHPFQKVIQVDANTLRGPGVADAKGGLVVLLTALQALEQSDLASTIGWEVLLNPDEEIGSPGSAALLHEAAKRNHFGLVFEPALPDGSLVGARKGSGNFTIVIRGRAAHAGRDFHLGRSAILIAAEIVSKFNALQNEMPGIIVNCGTIEGGTAPNVVPDLAVARFNVRITTHQDQHAVETRISQMVDEMNRRDGIKVSLHGGFHSPPKPIDAKSSRLFDAVLSCGTELGMNLQIHPGGGTCDGNKLAAAGLPVVDTLGPIGGNLHSDREYVDINSLPERAKLTAILLLRLAGRSGLT